MRRLLLAGSAAALVATAFAASARADDKSKGAAAQPAGAKPGTPAPAPAPARPASPPPVAASGPEAVAQRLAVLRRKVLREEDFAENDDTNRDPFRSYLDTWIERPTRMISPTMSAIFAKYALEELTLIAVISGDANPRAMFRDPTGLGQTIKRGDYLSKSGARVTKILSDRVVLELSELTPGGTTKALERAILVNPEGTDQ
jgi:Tfp pilus assembly protein PilP